VKFKSKIEVESGLQIASGAGAAKVLTSDGSGNGTWQASSGAVEVYSGASPPARTTELLWIDTDETQPAYAAPTSVSALPSSPYDGQEVYYANSTMLAQGTIWHLRYRAGSANAQKWEFLGGAELHNATPGPNTGTSYPSSTWAICSSSPTLLTPLAGIYLVRSVLTMNPAQICTLVHGVGVGGNPAAIDGNGVSGGYAPTAGGRVNYTAEMTTALLAAGVTIDQRFWHNQGGAMNTTFSGMWLGIRPLRLT
jgi:hypothetical protein